MWGESRKTEYVVFFETVRHSDLVLLGMSLSGKVHVYALLEFQRSGPLKSEIWGLLRKLDMIFFCCVKVCNIDIVLLRLNWSGKMHALLEFRRFEAYGAVI